MKQYKIRVPKIWFDEARNKVTRQEIHELVRIHSLKLEYRCNEVTWEKSSDYVILDNKGYPYFYTFVGVEPDDTINGMAGKEISWQDFLQLTPQDVQDDYPNIDQVQFSDSTSYQLGKFYKDVQDETECYPIEKASKSFDSFVDSAPLREKAGKDNPQPEPTVKKFDRDKMAWEILKIIIPLSIRYVSNKDDKINYAYDYVDKFIEKAGKE